MGFGGNAARPAQKLDLLSRTAEDKANTQPATSPSAAHSAAAAAAAPRPSEGSNNTGTTRKRLRPMELKQQQRQLKEQRKRAAQSSASSSSKHPAGDLSTVAPASLALIGDRLESTKNGGGSGAGRQQPQAAAGSPAGATTSLRDRRAVRGGKSRGGSNSEPLRRSASSPPNIGCSKG